MKKEIFLFRVLIFLMYITSVNAQQDTNSVMYHINSNVRNSEESYFQAIESNWKAYINSQDFVNRDSEYWNNENVTYSDFGYLSVLMDLRQIINNNEKIQCTILGIRPVEKNYYLCQTMFTQINESSENRVELKYIITVYAKKFESDYRFISGTEYHKQIYENRKIGNINYVIHPQHSFNEDDAYKMNEFNNKIAKLFEIEPLGFEYVVANNTNDLSNIIGLDFFSYTHQPVQSGGMADIYNTIIYAGNNSSYYPHEVVHLYTHAKFPRQFHPWVDEGIAALFGGSTGYKIEWHWEKLRKFIEANPNYELNDLSKLETDIPNGEYMSDFRYAIGALLCSKVYKKEGMQGLFDLLQSGRSEDDYFAILENKLGVNRGNFGTYVKAEILKFHPIEESDLEKFKY